MSHISFSDPGYFILLPLALPAVAACWYFGLRRYLTGRKKYGEAKLVDRYTRKPKLVSQVARLIVMLLVAALMVVALAGPQTPAQPIKVQSGSLQVMAVMDVTRSMGAEDYTNAMPQTWKLKFFDAHGTRLDEAKYVLESHIMPAVENNQLGLVTYQGAGFPAGDLTSDFGYLDYVLDNWVQIGDAPYGTTQNNIKISNIAAGLETAVKEFKQFGSAKAQKVIVLFSDGDNDADQASMQKVRARACCDAHQACDHRSWWHTRAHPGLQLRRAVSPGYYKYSDGTMPTTGIDEGNLVSLAQATNGTYIHLNPNHLPKHQLAKHAVVGIKDRDHSP